ncbi:MFS transporter [Lysobacter silvisoli]|uniref:MFS transporter n=1 Tax=Lysobacter silvisoli TaxID=2293254 RepID=A0A371JZ64_9GAMM|nr:MFS transporter [Lysobacter silvisoli]RDZ26890.1 MFS transporter [Lysobacter silvisoli]
MIATPATTAAPTARALGRKDLRTLMLAALGGALEFYDFVIFVFLTESLRQLFFPPDMPGWLSTLQVYGIFAAGYLVRPIGGIVMAHFGDRSGRKRMFTLSVFLMAVPTLAIGLLPVYAQIGIAAPLLLLALRIVQGIAIGGEVPGAWTFVAEHVPPQRVGFACASLSAGLTAGILIGSLISAAVNTWFAPQQVLDWAWRLPFLIGGVFGFFAVYLRRWLSETPVFVAMRESRQLAQELPLKQVLRRHGGAVALSMLVTWLLTAAIVVIILMTPTIVQQRFGIAPAQAFLGNSLAAFCLTLSAVAAGLLADKLGRGRALLIGAIGVLLSSYALYYDLNHGAEHFLLMYALAGTFVGVVGVIPTVMVAAFPPPVRFSGLSFSYNVAYAVFGATTPTLLASPWMRGLGGMAPAYYVMAVALIGVAVALYLIVKRPPDYVG